MIRIRRTEILKTCPTRINGSKQQFQDPNPRQKRLKSAERIKVQNIPEFIIKNHYNPEFQLRYATSIIL